MRASAFDPPEIPAAFWERADVGNALRDRDMGALFKLVRQYTGLSQTRIGTAVVIPQGRMSEIVNGTRRVAATHVFERIADGLNMPGPARVLLGLTPLSQNARSAAQSSHVSNLLSLDSADGPEEEDDVRRRTFVGLTSTTLLGTVLGDTDVDPPLDAEPLACALSAHDVGALAQTGPPPDITALNAAVSTARRQYQGCRYSELLGQLPPLLTQLHVACMTLDGQTQKQAFTLTADAHHVAAGLLLKLGDDGLAYLAADRSMRAARASEDPVTVGASARIVTHALMNGKHLQAAVSTVSSYAARLDHEVAAHTPESLSVYGSLLLRGAVAAAQDDNRATAHELLGEAEDAAKRLGIDGNLRWTAFGPTNAALHRVNIAVTLGDAGTAVDVARKVDLTIIEVTERKATLLIDVARAFLQWGRHEKAYLALRAADEVAHEEVTGRPSVHRVVRELLITAPPSIRRDTEQFAARIGVAR